MSYAQQAINSLDQTINSFKSRVDVKVSDVSTSTANIQQQPIESTRILSGSKMTLCTARKAKSLMRTS